MRAWIVFIVLALLAGLPAADGVGAVEPAAETPSNARLFVGAVVGLIAAGAGISVGLWWQRRKYTPQRLQRVAMPPQPTDSDS